MNSAMLRSWAVAMAIAVAAMALATVVGVVVFYANDDPRPNDHIPVLVLHAREDIPAGMSAEDAIGSVELRDTPRLEVKLGAVGDMEHLAPGVALVDIPEGTQITAQLFGCTKEKWDQQLCGVQR